MSTAKLGNSKHPIVQKTAPETGCGPTLEKLYHAVQGIQYGELPDTHNWNLKIEV